MDIRSLLATIGALITPFDRPTVLLVARSGTAQMELRLPVSMRKYSLRYGSRAEHAFCLALHYGSSSCSLCRFCLVQIRRFGQVNCRIPRVFLLHRRLGRTRLLFALLDHWFRTPRGVGTTIASSVQAHDFESERNRTNVLIHMDAAEFASSDNAAQRP
jgi:hypothetical protein